MKKRILTTVLLLVCMVLNVFLATSCGGGESELAAFENALENTAPTSVNGEVTLSTGSATLKIAYAAVIEEDGTFTVMYGYNKLNDVSSGAADEVYTFVEGTVTYDGTSYSDSSLAAKISADAVATAIDLGADMEYTLSSDGKVLSALVAAEATEDAFGIDYAADVRFVLTQANEKIVSLALVYTLETGEVVEASCNYN